MKKLSSKDKGDIGLTAVIAHLQKNGITSAIPLSEHQPFDLIAINEDRDLFRVSVKYRALVKGSIEIPLRTISSNSQGYKIKFADLNQIDAYAIYCPETEKCYYVHSDDLKKYKNLMSLRVDEISVSYRGDRNGIKMAKDYESVEKVFKKKESSVKVTNEA